MSSPPDDLAECLMSLARARDKAAIEGSLARSEAKKAVDALATAQRDLYWKHKDIAAMLTVSRAGITHLLQSADAGEARHHAKALAYNVGSFTWPGWNEPGIVLSAADVAAGHEASLLNLRLAEELQRPAKAKAHAHWPLGAHQLAAAAYGLASKSFRSGKLHAERSDDPLLASMLDGYLLSTVVLAEPEKVEACQEFDAALRNLRGDGREDAREYADQLATAFAALKERAQGCAARQATAAMDGHRMEGSVG